MKNENKTQHTQGEWKVGQTHSGEIAIFANHPRGHNPQIATLEPFCKSEETKANAQRIVKAVNMHGKQLDAHKMNHFLANEFWKLEIELKKDPKRKEKLLECATRLLEDIRVNCQVLIKQAEQK